FKIAAPNKEWSPRDIVRAHRIGSTLNAHNDPRPIIVRFLHWDDKLSIYKGREELRSREIRVADDLTKRQRLSLKKLKDSGRDGYFYKGELIERNANSSQSTEGSRVFMRGKRHRTSEQGSVHFGDMDPDHSSMDAAPVPSESVATNANTNGSM
ncbi:MAG: hypothetical protein N0E48_20450, partial [Candidatus Thiodiazotropha endolucinida]|nr:hypothetical protein [Candidatus Thiodiazotropha taylori]MCW4345704.1 hypothetical protein [Candidatus Thiodiazotropha endolucinida]